jgi:hypothetical protein
MDDKYLITVALTLVGWIVSYRLGLHSGRRRAAEDLANRRAQMATALLVELRVLETFLRRLRTGISPLASHWAVPGRYLEAKVGSLEILSAPAVRDLMEFHGLLDDIRAYRDRHPPDEPPTAFQNWFVRLKATFALQRIAALKAELLRDGGLLPTGGPGEVIFHPNLPPMPDRAFPEYDFEFDEDGNLLPGSGNSEGAA